MEKQKGREGKAYFNRKRYKAYAKFFTRAFF
jgi:hypothetical protein